MNLWEKEISELLNILRRTSDLKERTLWKELFSQATSISGHKTDFDAAIGELNSNIGRQISVIGIIVRKNKGRRSHVTSIRNMNKLRLAAFLAKLVAKMNSKEFRDREFQLSDESKYWNLHASIQRFANTLNLRRKMNTLSNYEAPEELRQAVAEFLEREYNISGVERMCLTLRALLLKQLEEVDAIIPPSSIREYMQQEGISQLKEVPRDKLEAVNENEEICNALLNSIHSEGIVTNRFKAFVIQFFNKSKAIEEMLREVLDPNEEDASGVI